MFNWYLQGWMGKHTSFLIAVCFLRFVFFFWWVCYNFWSILIVASALMGKTKKISAFFCAHWITFCFFASSAMAWFSSSEVGATNCSPLFSAYSLISWNLPHFRWEQVLTRISKLIYNFDEIWIFFLSNYWRQFTYDGSDNEQSEGNPKTFYWKKFKYRLYHKSLG